MRVLVGREPSIPVCMSAPRLTTRTWHKGVVKVVVSVVVALAVAVVAAALPGSLALLGRRSAYVI